MIFIDTGAFLARYLVKDQFHQRAKSAWSELIRLDWKCYTSDYVLDETFTLLARRSNYPFAVERARAIMTSDTLHILRPSYKDELEALVFFEKLADQKISYTDCISFVLMRAHRIDRAFSFDRHFRDAGFERWPVEAL
jgi:predicted nucleic acid-binding protein